MRLTDYIYPHIDEDPRSGCQMIDSTKFRCVNCIQYGGINSEEMRIEPCTICAMANGGAWGWEKDHYGDPTYSEKTNGNPPGKDSITDVLSNHNVDPEKEWFFTDEEVVLGFSQYALYNHYKWKDILDLGEGISKHKTGVPPMSYLQIGEGLDYHWYWWKIIPYGIVLPKRLRNVLQKQLVKYEHEMINSELFVPKTHQLKGDRELSDDIWETFWDTYVEPGHVVHLFSLTLETVLQLRIPHTSIQFSPQGWFGHELDSFSVVEYQDIDDHNLPECDKSWMNGWSSSRFTEGSKCFILSGRGYLFNGVSNRALRILDRDVFGTYLIDVIDYSGENAFYRRSGITSSSRSIKDIWNTLNNDTYSLAFGIVKNLCVESTEWFEERLDYAPHPMNDYSNERFFRDPLIFHRIHSHSLHNDDNIHVVEYEIESDDGEGSNHDWTEHVNKLKELQMIVDDEGVKDKIDDGTYLKLMNGLGELYKMYQ